MFELNEKRMASQRKNDKTYSVSNYPKLIHEVMTTAYSTYKFLVKNRSLSEKYM